MKNMAAQLDLFKKLFELLSEEDQYRVASIMVEQIVRESSFMELFSDLLYEKTYDAVGIEFEGIARQVANELLSLHIEVKFGDKVIQAKTIGDILGRL
jgi:hypothetical protein